jgi:single-strand DNA-binding protein
MSGVNKVILVGNLGKDPEVQTFDNGIKKASFSLATTEKFKNKDGVLTEETEWHKIVVWGKQAELAETYLRKGNQLFVEGRIRTRSWDDKDGNKRYTTEIAAINLTFLGQRKDQGIAQNEPSMVAEGEIPPPAPDDDLPF